MRLLGFYWGIAGVIMLLSSAVYRVSPRIVEIIGYSLSPLQWLVLLVFVPYMAYAEGYKGFHRAFSPRVIARARYLRQNMRPGLALLAPLFCMGYIHATRRRAITSILVTSAIVAVVLLVRMAPQPWRGIIDAGVVVGLVLGILSLLYFWLQVETGHWHHTVPIDLPLSGQPDGKGRGRRGTVNRAERP